MSYFDLTSCKYCKYLNSLYVPPIKKYENVPQGPVCTYNLGENQVLWLGDDKGCCEVFEERKRDE